MLTPETMDATARAFLEAHHSRTRYLPLDPTTRAAPLDEAYRIQDALQDVSLDAGHRPRWGLFSETL